MSKKSLSAGEKAGFTLIELLVVVLIIGILAAFAWPQYQVVVATSKYAAVMSMLTHYKQMQEMYYLRHGKYAGTWQALGVELPADAKPSATDLCFVANKKMWCITPGSRVYVSMQGVVPGLEYSFAFSHSAYPDRRTCIAYDSSKLAGQVCENVGGVKEETAGTEGHTYTRYLLP